MVVSNAYAQSHKEDYQTEKRVQEDDWKQGAKHESHQADDPDLSKCELYLQNATCVERLVR